MADEDVTDEAFDSSLVIVVDSQRQYVESVPAAIARMALRSNRARILYKNPCTIQLAPGLHRCPRPARDSRRQARTVEVFHGAMSVMSNFSAKNPVQLTRQIDEYLKTNPEEVWVKATGEGQVVLSSRKKGEALGVPPIQPGDPVLLTRYATVEELKYSDLRHMIMQGVLRLMTSEEAEEFIVSKAKRLGTSPDRIKEEALRRESAFLNHEPGALNDGRRADQRAQDIMAKKLSSQTYDADEEGGMKINPTLTKDVVKPKIVHLCRQASLQLKPADRKPANELHEEFRAIEDSLSMDDLEYIVANVPYKTIKSWAMNLQAAISGIEDSNASTDDAQADAESSI